jgi:hypothetical protein
MASGGQQYDTHRLIAIVKGFRIRELKPVLKDLDLPVSGKVAAMQERLVESKFVVSLAILCLISPRLRWRPLLQKSTRCLLLLPIQRYEILPTVATQSATIE